MWRTVHPLLFAHVGDHQEKCYVAGVFMGTNCERPCTSCTTPRDEFQDMSPPWDVLPWRNETDAKAVLAQMKDPSISRTQQGIISRRWSQHPVAVSRGHFRQVPLSIISSQSSLAILAALHMGLESMGGCGSQPISGTYGGTDAPNRSWHFHPLEGRHFHKVPGIARAETNGR